MTRSLCFVALVSLFSMASGKQSSAQTLQIACLGAFTSNCTAKVDQQSVQSASIELQITPGRDLAGQKVTFRSSSGAVHPDTAKVDADGKVRATWFRPRGADTAAIAVNLTTATNISVTTLLRVEPTPVTTQAIDMKPWRGFDQSWFTGALLPKPIEMELELPTDLASGEREKVCTSQRVQFIAPTVVGAVSPDTAIPVYIDVNNQKRCFARGLWTLGGPPGPKRIRARLITSTNYRPATSTVEVHATARNLPKLVGGFVVAQRRPFDAFKAGKDTTIRIERVRSDGTKIAFDSVKSAPGTERMEDKIVGGVFAGLTGPVVPGWHWFSLTAGVDLGLPRERFYAGLSVLRPFGLNTEAFNFDAHLVMHWARDTRVKDVEACRTVQSCATERDFDYQGIGLVFTVDAATIFADLIKKLIP